MQLAAGRRTVFREDRDRFVYLHLLRQAGERHGLAFEGYCLMDDRVHLIALPQQPGALERAVDSAHAAYAHFFRTTYSQQKRVWQDHFEACRLEGEARWRALAYIEMCPVRARLAARPDDHQWSSAQAHLRSERPYLRLAMEAWAQCWDELTWRAQLHAMGHDYAFWKELERASQTGQPLGGPAIKVCSDPPLAARAVAGQPALPFAD